MFGSLLGGLLGGVGSLFGGSATKKAAGLNKRELDKYLNQGTSYIDAGADTASGYLTDVGDLWSNLAQESGGLSGLNLYGDALGVNGADGRSRATNAFQSSPGYEFQLGQGLDALERRASAQGRLSSGQTGLDTINYATGLANQDYNNWLSNLSGYGQQQSNIYTGATTGQAGSLSDLASLATGTAGQKVSLLGDVTSGRMGANNQTAAGTQQQLSGLGGFGQALGSIFGGYM